MPEVFRDDLGSIRQTDVPFEVRRRVPPAVRADVALIVEIRDPLVEQIRHQIPVLDRLPQRVRVSRVTEVREGVSPAFCVSELPAALDLARRRGQPELVGRTEVIEHAEPVAEAGTVALVHDHQPEEIGREVLEQLPAFDDFV